MINLLPPQNKTELDLEEKWKLVMLSGLFFIMFLVCLSLILISINLYISGEVMSQKILLEQREKEFRIPQVQALQKNLAAFNETIFQLDLFYQNQFNISDVLKKVSATLPEGIYLKNLSCLPQVPAKDGWKTGCSLSGFSPTREILLDFKANLEKEESFKEIAFPPASWVKQTDINFSVAFKVRPYENSQ